MLRFCLRAALALLLLWLATSLAAGLWLLPGLLLGVPTPQRTDAYRVQVLEGLLGPGDQATCTNLVGGEGRRLELVHVRRPHPKGVVIYLHGFGDDAWGTLGRARALPEWDAAGFTFRGRDRDGTIPCTLGGWERADGVAVVQHLLGLGYAPNQILFAGWSMGAGTALLILEDLEREGTQVGGALLECPFEDLSGAARDHLRGTLGAWEVMARLAEGIALHQTGRRAQFTPAQVSPVRAASRVTCRVALVTGDADGETPIAGVRAIARTHPDLTVVPGAGHCEASNRLPGGWEGWARERLLRWGY